jgi:hypothetical protein
MTRKFGRFLRNNAIALLALFVALSGTTFAASLALPKNSVGTPQLKNGAVTKRKINRKTLRQLKGNRGLAGQRGPTGSQGPAGPFPSGNLPGGTTVRGSYAIYNSAGDLFAATHIDFIFPMASGLTAHWVLQGAEPPSSCPGSVTNPQAAAGQLCVFEATHVNTAPPNGASYSVEVPENIGAYGASGRFGATLFVGAAATGSPSYSIGAWAASAPAGTS